MHSLILEDQNVFVSSRAIQDNLVIAHKVFHFLKMSRRRMHSMATKLDMYKAYDQMSWNFLRLVLVQMGFFVY